MIDFNKMNPREFEEYVAKRFQALGFRTQMTQTTGDGGIDIVANFDGEIFKGKYLIQCKRWSKNVGEPPIRDLYGVVQAENVLKGIVVTSSDFSQKAKVFSEGKNIDLISGDTLRKLAKEELGETETNKPVYSVETKGFLEDPEFPKQRYTILTNQVERNPKLKDTYQILIKLLAEETLRMGHEVRDNGLLEEFFYYAERYRDTFTTKKDNESVGSRIGINYTLALLNFIKGDLIKVYELVVDLKEGYNFKTNWDVKWWWGLPSRFRTYNRDLFFCLLSILDIEIDGSEPCTFHYLYEFKYVETNTKHLSTVKDHVLSKPLDPILKQFRIQETEGFSEQREILKEIINRTLYLKKTVD